MTTIEIACADEVLISLKEDAGTFAGDMRMSAAAKFYELGRLSSGRAAELAGLPRVVFLKRLAEYGVSALSATRKELLEDMGNA
jgi:predicted HTH domain antitoxin